MNVRFTTRAWDQYRVWVESDEPGIGRLNALIENTLRSPFSGIGKPEPLLGTMKGWWSRRIDREHRLVYRVIGQGAEQRLEILACRLHYER